MDSVLTEEMHGQGNVFLFALPCLADQARVVLIVILVLCVGLGERKRGLARF